MTKTWSDLTKDQRCDVVSRICRNEDIEKIALAYGVRASSLSRKIRKLKKDGLIDQYIIQPPSDTEQSTFIEDVNEATLEWKSGFGPIRTLDALIESHKIDLDIWKQYGSVVHNTWTTPRAKRDSDGFEYFQNHQVKANFIRKVPIPIFPVISPVTIETQYKAPPPPRTSGIATSYIFADPQFGYVKDLKTAKLTPFHNRKVLDLHLQMIQLLQPDRVDILGDWLDMTEWTDRFMREPEFYWTTQPALLESVWWLSQIREIVPEAHVSLHQGNHDKRIDDALKTHLPAAYALKAVDELELPPALSLPKLLALHKLQVEWIGDYPNDTVYLNPLLSVKHEDKALSPGNTAKAVLRDAYETIVFGHIHRREMITKSVTTMGGTRYVTACCPGCSCWTDGRTPGSNRESQWQNGSLIAEYEIGGEMNNLTPILIEKGKLIYQKKLFEGRDRLEEIRPAMDGWHV